MFKIGDPVVYPMHGAGIIDRIEEKTILRSSARPDLTTSSEFPEERCRSWSLSMEAIRSDLDL